MEIRDAVLSDVIEVCDVLRRSIIELCAADHQNDPEKLASWLSDKTPESIASWVGQSNSCLLVAVEHKIIIAVGAVTDEGEIKLLYVYPNARLRGVSKALLSALEARAADWGNRRCRLHSTSTARQFYERKGYVLAGTPNRRFGMAGGYPMVKTLIVPIS